MSVYCSLLVLFWSKSQSLFFILSISHYNAMYKLNMCHNAAVSFIVVTCIVNYNVKSHNRNKYFKQWLYQKLLLGTLSTTNVDCTGRKLEACVLALSRYFSLKNYLLEIRYSGVSPIKQ